MVSGGHIHGTAGGSMPRYTVGHRYMYARKRFVITVGGKQGLPEPRKGRCETTTQPTRQRRYVLYSTKERRTYIIENSVFSCSYKCSQSKLNASSATIVSAFRWDVTLWDRQLFLFSVVPNRFVSATSPSTEPLRCRQPRLRRAPSQCLVCQELLQSSLNLPAAVANLVPRGRQYCLDRSRS